ncbi:DNA fragmentation factor subunit beta isoform 3-T3 [Glossophaga mutica]
MMSVFRKPKTFKLRALHSPQKFGVAGKSCQEVLRKGCLHFQVPPKAENLSSGQPWPRLGSYMGCCGVHDNTPARARLPPLPLRRWHGGDRRLLPERPRQLGARAAHRGPDLGGFVFHKPHVGVIQAARQLLSDERAPLRQKLLADLLHTISENIAAETRAEDPSWFEGLESRFRSKCSYLRFSCESRIRSYLREVSAHTSVVGAQAREEFARVVDAMGQKLRAAKYNGCYFDRGAKAGSRLCTPEGWFSCQGPFDTASCASRHSINPYGSRESRVLFSTWNLDHVIEKKRTVIPTLAEAIEDQGGRQLDWEYFYGLLFTCENLKLVHVTCHKKTTHRLSCDPRRIYRPRAKPTKPRRKRAARQGP